MKPAAFEYCRADSLDEATAIFAEHGRDANVLAGGMSLGPMLNMRLARPAAVIDIKPIPGLDAVEIGKEIRTGATLTQARALENKALMQAAPLLALALPHVGHFQTRNRGTLCGSVAHADPSAETPLVLVTLGGAVELRSQAGTRRVAARHFFVDALVTSRKDDELVTALFWPRAREGTRYAFEELAQRHGDFAIVACAAEAMVDGQGRLASLSFGLGGVETRPVVIDAGKFAGERADMKLAERLSEEAAQQVDPLNDFKASADYRRALVRALGFRVLSKAFRV